MSTATDMIARYRQAEIDILEHGQTSALEGRTLTMADLEAVRAGRREWERKAAAEARVDAGRAPMGYSVAQFSD